MSWSINALGKPSAVAAKIAGDIARVKCAEPEETIKNTVANAIATALGAFPDGMAVKVEASGSQSSTGTDGKVTNSLYVKIEPQWGYVE